jgi:hypothetical protein
MPQDKLGCEQSIQTTILTSCRVAIVQIDQVENLEELYAYYGQLGHNVRRHMVSGAQFGVEQLRLETTHGFLQILGAPVKENSNGGIR